MVTRILVIVKFLVTKYSYIIMEIVNYKLSIVTSKTIKIVTNKAIDRILETNYTKATSKG